MLSQPYSFMGYKHLAPINVLELICQLWVERNGLEPIEKTHDVGPYGIKCRYLRGSSRVIVSFAPEVLDDGSTVADFYSGLTDLSTSDPEELLSFWRDGNIYEGIVNFCPTRRDRP